MTPGKNFLESSQIRKLARRSDRMGLWLTVHCWGVIALAVMLFATLPNPVTFLLAVLVIGSRQLGLAILMHEAAHNALFKSRRINDFVGEWMCGRPILAELPAYRHYHLLHHRFTQTDQDPDLHLSAKFPTTKASMKRKFLRDLTGQTGIKAVVSQFVFALRLAGDVEAVEAATLEKAQAFQSVEFWKSLPMFIAVGAIMSIFGEWWYGFAFWLLPYLTWFQFVLRVRNIAEHGATEVSVDPFRNVRTTRAGFLARMFVAPYWVNFHLEHHMIMHVPCWQLPNMQEALKAKGFGDRMNIATSYKTAMTEAGWK